MSCDPGIPLVQPVAELLAKPCRGYSTIQGPAKRVDILAALDWLS